GLPDPSLGDRHLSYLPLAHAFERYAGHWNSIVRRAEVFFCPDLPKVFEYAAEVHPTVMIGSPRVWEKLQAGLQAAQAAEPASGEAGRAEASGGRRRAGGGSTGRRVPFAR